MSRVGIIGAGAWGTALAVAAVRAGHDVRLWGHQPDLVAAVNADRENRKYLAGVILDPAIIATASLDEAIAADLVLLAPPAQRLREIAAKAAAGWHMHVPAVISCKGIEQGTGALMTQVIADALPGVPAAVLSGPTFARELADDLPTVATLAADDLELAAGLARELSTRRFRLYASDDPTGAQVGGAVKNVIAIAAGIVEGRNLGDNARAALITRGLAEIARLGAALGARPETFMGPAGLGDLTLTCSARQSRNFSLGVQIGHGRSLQECLLGRDTIAEGVYTVRSIGTLSRRLGVEMPICAAIDRVLHLDANVDSEVEGLLARPLRTESPASGFDRPDRDGMH